MFRRYAPTTDKRELLSRAIETKLRYTKEPPLRVEVELRFTAREDAEAIYEIEDECRELYAAESFKILPHFPPESFGIECLGEIAFEAAACGRVLPFEE